MLSGIYHFANIQIESDGIISADMSDGAVEIIVAGNANFGDGAKFIRSGSDKFDDFKLFFATKDSIIYGHDINFKGAIRAPFAEVILGDRNTYAGTLWSRRIGIGNGTSFISERSISDGNGNSDIELIYASDWIGDATRFKHNGFNANSTFKNGFIAESQFFRASSYAVLASSEYSRNRHGTWSCWLYLDGSSGRILSSSNISAPNWEWKFNDEGNLAVRIGSRSLFLPIPNNTWVLLSVVQDSNNMYAYLNDVLLAKGPVGDLISTANPWFGSLAGTIGFDELRISEIARNEDWIKLDYHTQKISYGENENKIEFASH